MHVIHTSGHTLAFLNTENMPSTVVFIFSGVEVYLPIPENSLSHGKGLSWCSRLANKFFFFILQTR